MNTHSHRNHSGIHVTSRQPALNLIMMSIMALILHCIVSGCKADTEDQGNAMSSHIQDSDGSMKPLDSGREAEGIDRSDNKNRNERSGESSVMVRQIRLFTEAQSSQPLMTERAAAIDRTQKGLIDALGFELGVRLSSYAVAWSHAGAGQEGLVGSSWEHSKALAQKTDIAIVPLPERVLENGFDPDRHATALAYLLTHNKTIEGLASTYGERPASLARLSTMLHIVMWLYSPTDSGLNTEFIRSLRFLRDANRLPSELFDGLLLAIVESESHDIVKAKALESIKAIGEFLLGH